MIILLNGKARSGKDTVADYLVEYHGFKKVSFAGLLKRAVHTIFNINDMEIENKESPLVNWPEWSPRTLYQFVGTELFRNHIDDNIWAKALWFSEIQNSKDSNFVISDLRFQNELDFFEPYIEEYKVFSIKIKRNGFNGNVGLKNHASEKDKIKTDFKIKNNGTLDSLYERIEEIYNEINRRISE